MHVDTRKIIHAVAIPALVFVLLAAADTSSQGPPNWAYGTKPSSIPEEKKEHPSTSNSSLKHVPGSTLEFTQAQINDPFGPADWFPNDHPQMPEIVAHGEKPKVWACSLCHYPNGKGRPENAGVAGLPVSYFIEQMNEFRKGERKSADPAKKNTNLMAVYAKTMNDEQIRAAAEYFGSMKWTPWIKVAEATRAPKTRISIGMFLPVEGAGDEPLGQRIIEVPVSVEQSEVLRNPRSGFLAYAPPGSIEKGEKLATQGEGKTIPCANCHGLGLRGLGPVPGIAGRSPSYLMRQLYDMRAGTRNGQWTELMKPVVKALSEEDMLNLAAYSASLKP